MPRDEDGPFRDLVPYWDDPGKRVEPALACELGLGRAAGHSTRSLRLQRQHRSASWVSCPRIKQPATHGMRSDLLRGSRPSALLSRGAAPALGPRDCLRVPPGRRTRSSVGAVPRNSIWLHGPDRQSQPSMIARSAFGIAERAEQRKKEGDAVSESRYEPHQDVQSARAPTYLRSVWARIRKLDLGIE